MHKQSIVRLWGLILDRPDALTHASAATTHGNTAGHVDDAAGHYDFFNSDRGKGTASSAGFELELELILSRKL